LSAVVDSHRGLLAAFALMVASLYGQESGYSESHAAGDFVEWVFTDRVYMTRAGLEVRADHAMVILDRQEYSVGIASATRDAGLPRRGTQLPDPRRSLSESVVRGRLESFLRAARRRNTALPPQTRDRLDLFRSLYLEGNVVIVQDGLEIVRASRAFLSSVDDRAVFRDVTLRLRSFDERGRESTIVVRGHRIVRQGRRITGRDLSVTTCTAGDPHVELLSGEVEIIERDEQFQIRGRSNCIALSGLRVLPLPDVDFLSSEQNPLLIRSVASGYSSVEGWRGQVVLGHSFNRLGGALHNSLTGKSPESFRGDWRLGIGYVETRGSPLDAELDYRADGMYSGRMSGFFLEDRGDNIREIRSHIDGTPIAESRRTLLRTENRVHLGERTSLDLSAFEASDPAVYSEFFPGRYYGDELPETSVHLRHGQDNVVATATGRWNLNDFALADDRSLSPKFVEELPHLTFDWFSEPLLELPGSSPLLMTASTGVARYRSRFDPRWPTPVDDETLRLDAEFELSAPFCVGSFGVRPFAATRLTHYDNSPMGNAKTRSVFSAGASMGTRLERTWRWNEDGDIRGIRHVVSPTVTFANNFGVHEPPASLHPFDELDSLDDNTSIRIGALQQLQLLGQNTESRGHGDVVWLDAAQNITPISDRDNDGHRLGLFEFELVFRPQSAWARLPRWLLLIEGEQDWNRRELRTFNAYSQIELVGVTWFGEYRADRTARGVLGYGGTVPIRGRWTAAGGAQYDLETEESLQYSARLIRADHDRRIAIGIQFNVVTDETSFDIEFELGIGGVFDSPRRRWHGHGLYGGGSVTDF
jgi:hypothetical protein